MRTDKLYLVIIATLLLIALLFFYIHAETRIKTKGIYVNPEYNTTCVPVNPGIGENITSSSEFYLEIYYETDAPYRIGIDWHIKDLTTGWRGYFSMLDDMRLQVDITQFYKPNHCYEWYVEIYTKSPDGWIKLWSNENAKWTFNTIPPKNPSAPVADAGGPYYGVVGQPIQFDASGSYDPDGYIVKYEWNFGVIWLENDTATGVNPTYTYTSIPPSGYYDVVLTVTDNDGYTATDVTRAYISESPTNKPPVANFVWYPASPLVDEIILFNASSSYDLDGNIVGYNWNFGDGTTVAGPKATVTHSYGRAGTYTVTLEVVDNLGASSVIRKNITVSGIYKLDISVIPDNGGTVNIEPYSENMKYVEGTEVTLTAQPNYGYVFREWRGDAQGSSTQVTVTMDSDKSIIAVFEEKQSGEYVLNVNVNNPSAGWVEVEPAGGSYPAGTVVTLTAYSKEGYRFSHWAGDVSGSRATISIVMNSDKTVMAYFEPVEEEKELTVAGGIAVVALLGAIGVIVSRKFNR